MTQDMMSGTHRLNNKENQRVCKWDAIPEGAWDGFGDYLHTMQEHALAKGMYIASTFIPRIQRPRLDTLGL